MLVYNKVDRLDFEPRIERDPEGRPVAVWISAAKRLGLDLLQQAISERISRVARRGCAAPACERWSAARQAVLRRRGASRERP